MNIKIDGLDKIALDRFVSTSGRYEATLAHRYEQGWNTYYIVVTTAGRVRKIIRLGVAATVGHIAHIRREWEDFKERMTAPAQEEREPTLLEEAEANALCLQEFYFQGELIGYTTLGQGEIVKTKPIGARIFVQPIIPVDEVSARLKAVGIEPVIADQNKPKPTMGVVLEVGNDPLIAEQFHVGDIVVYSKHAGDVIMEDGVEYRSLGHHEIIGVRRESLAAEEAS